MQRHLWKVTRTTAQREATIQKKSLTYQQNLVALEGI
jgi:hypothetical protein